MQMESNESPYLLLTWLQSGSEEMQLSALEQLCLALLQYESNEALIKFYPPSMYVPILSCLCQDFDISFVLLEAIIRTITYYMQAVPHEVINSLVNTKGTLMAICMRLENPNMEVSIESDLSQQIIKLLEELCKRDTKSLSNIGGASYIINFMSKTHKIIHLDTIKSGFYILYKIIDKIDANDKRLGDWFEFLSKFLKHTDNRIVEYSLHCLLVIIKMCNEKKVSTDPLGIEKIIDDLLLMIVQQLEIDNSKSDNPLNRNEPLPQGPNNKIGLSRTIIDLILCIIRSSTQFLCNLLVNNKLSDILFEIISQYDGASLSIVQLIEGIYDQINERVSYHSNEYLLNSKISSQMGFRMMHGRIYSDEMFQQHSRYHECLMKAVSTGSLDGLKELLLSTDFDPKYRDKWGQTPLNLASALGFTEGVNLLIARGIDPNMGERASSFHYLAAQGHVNVLDNILKNESLDFYMKDCEGFTIFDRMKQFINSAPNPEKAALIENLISKIEAQYSVISPEIHLAKEYFIKRMIPVLITIYFKNYRSSIRFILLELLNKIARSFNEKDHTTIIKENYQNELLPYHLSKMIYRVLLQDTGENVLEAIRLSLYLSMDFKHSKIYLNWFCRMGLREVLLKSMEKFSTLLSANYDSDNRDKIIPLTVDAEFSDYKITANNNFNCLNSCQLYYWGDWNIISMPDGLNIYNEYCYVFIANDESIICLNISVLIRKGVEVDNNAKESPKKFIKNQLFNQCIKGNNFRYATDDKSLSGVPENSVNNSTVDATDYEAVEIIDKTVNNRPDLVERLQEKYSSMLLSLQSVSMAVPFPKLLSGKMLTIKNLVITNFSNRLKICLSISNDNLPFNKQSNEVTDLSVSDEKLFTEISVNKISGFIVRSVNQIIYKTGSLNRQSGFKRLELLKSVTDKIQSSRIYSRENPIRDSICHRILINCKRQLELLNNMEEVPNKLSKNVSHLLNAINGQKGIDKYLININKLISSETTKPTPYELYKSQFLTVLIRLLQNQQNTDKFVSIFQENLPILTKSLVQLLEQVENLPNSHQVHSHISDHYLTRALHMRAILRSCNDHEQCDTDPIPDLSKYNFLVMPLSTPLNLKKSLYNLLQKLPWYRADKMSFNSIRQLFCKPFFVDFELEGSDRQGGFFEWLGTNGFRSRFMNPLKLNLISVLQSDNSTNVFSNLYNLFWCRNDVGKNIQNKAYTAIQGEASYIIIQLKHPLGLIPTKYCLGLPEIEGANLHCLVNWHLMASVDGINWDTLSIHDNDCSLMGSSTGTWTWSLNIEGALIDKVQNQGWTMFKIQKRLALPMTLKDIHSPDQENPLTSAIDLNSLNSGFWLNYVEFYGTVYSVTDAKREEIKEFVDDYISRFKIGTLVRHLSEYDGTVHNDTSIIGKVISPIKNGTVLIEWDTESGKSHTRHKMGAQGRYELSLIPSVNENIVETSEHRPKTFTESFIESKSSFEIHPESHEDIRNSFQDSISWVIDPNMSLPLRTSSLSSQRNNKFPTFFNKENLVEAITSKDIQQIYKKRRGAVEDYQEYNALIKSETEDMDMRYETSDEDNLHMDSSTVYIQSRMEYLNGFSSGSKPAIQVSKKDLANDEEQKLEKVKVPDESKKNFILSKQIKRKSSVPINEVKRETLKIDDNIDEMDISDESEYFEASLSADKFLRQISKYDNDFEINKMKPVLEKKCYSSSMRSHKYKQNLTGIGESSNKFKPVNIPHIFPGLVQPIDHKSSQNVGEILSNIEIINYHQNKALSKSENIIKSKSFGYSAKQFRLKLEIQIPVPVKCNFNFQKSADLDLSGIGNKDSVSRDEKIQGKDVKNKRIFEFVLNTESQHPIINYILSMLPLIDPIINTYPVESVSQLWHSQLTLYYGFCDKKSNGVRCKNCFYQKKLVPKSKDSTCTEPIDESATIIEVINLLKGIQSIITKKTAAQNSVVENNDPWIKQNVPWTDSCFISRHMCKTLLNQLEDVWGLLSKDTLPRWIVEWPQKYPFLFTYEMKVDILNAYWFGSSRSVCWLQQRTKPNLDYLRPTFREDIPSHFHFLGRLKKHIAHVPRPFYFGNTDVREADARSTFWFAVRDLFQFHSRNKEELEIQFESEEGTGLGPTLEFMNILSNEFMRIDTRMWIHCDSGVKDSGEHVYSENGLFPYPWPSEILSDDVLERFHILGIFIAKCLQDNRRIDLPFSESFLNLLCNEISEYDVTTYLEDFVKVYPMRGKFLKSLSTFCDAKQNLLVQNCDSDDRDFEEQLKTISMNIFGSTLENLDIDMEFLSTTKEYCMEPYSLCKTKMDCTDTNNDGRNKYNEPLSESNAEIYIEETLKFTMNHGIRRQIQTMKDGFNEVFPIKGLLMFTAAELKQLLCGEQDIKWTLDDLYQFTEPTQGYTKNSQNYKFFLEVLEEMTQAERKMFVQFVTGCTSLPSGGLKNLKPRLTVVKKNMKDGGPYPSVNTCMHYLKLPEYTSKVDLKSKLMDASRQHGFHLN